MIWSCEKKRLSVSFGGEDGMRMGGYAEEAMATQEVFFGRQ